MSRNHARLVSLLLFVALASAAQARWDPVAFYHKRAAAIREKVRELSPETTRTVVLLGDSLTQGHPAKDLAGYPVVNQGISGDRIDVPTSGTGVRLRLDLVSAARPAHVFVMIGINDLWGAKLPVEEAKSRYTGLVKALLQQVPEAKIHLVSLLPTGAPHAGLNSHVNTLNDHIRALARKHALDYLDLHAAMQDEKGELRDGLDTDGIHLTPAAYEIWTKSLEERLRAD